MTLFQVKPLPPEESAPLSQITRNLKAALSYIAFYSSDSPFVVQAVQKCHKDLEKLLRSCGRVILHFKAGHCFFNDTEVPALDDLRQALEDHNLKGVELTNGLTTAELGHWLRNILLPVKEQAPMSGPVHAQGIALEDQIEVSDGTTVAEVPGPSAASDIFQEPLQVPPVDAFTPSVMPSSEDAPVANFTLKEILQDEDLKVASSFVSNDAGSRTNEALLSFLAEAWQHAQLQKRSLNTSPEMAQLSYSFEKLFDRLLDRLEKTSPELSNIYRWFRTPEGQLLENGVTTSMFPLLEVAVKNDWTAVLYDPATEGLINECLTYWGANGKQDLVEKAVLGLASGLDGDSLEKQLALTHLMDARPWVRDSHLVKEVLDRLGRMLAREKVPGLYQSALLLAWDLMEPALAAGHSREALSLLTTLHFHAEDEDSEFPERISIARHWLFERSTPEMIRRCTTLAHEAGQLDLLPLLGEMAAPLFLDGFLTSTEADRSSILAVLAEIKEPVRSTLAERLAEATEEADVTKLIPVIRVCGLDAALSLQLSSWLSKAGREVKMDLLGMIEEIGDAAGGPALRLAVLDDSEEIAALAARIIGKIGFAPGWPLLQKAAKIREERFPANDAFLTAVCQSAGQLKVPAALEFLQDIARKKPLFRGKNFSLPVRLEAIKALTQLNQPEVWSFLETLMSEKTPALQETLDQIIHERIQKM